MTPTIETQKALEALLGPMIAELVEAKATELSRANEAINQRQSPAGPRRHIKIARELIASGSPDAWRAGRLFWVRRGALEGALAAHIRTTAPEPVDAAEDALCAELGIAKVQA